MCHSERTSKRELREVRTKSRATEARVAELERELARLVKSQAASEVFPSDDVAQSVS
jgi:hypothetical protein